MQWLRTLWSRARNSGPPVLRAVVAPTGDPYREQPGIRLLERDVEPSTLGHVLAAVRAADLVVRPRRRGFDLVGSSRARVLPIRVRDAERVVPTELECGTKAPELLIDLSLALVPVFGALIVELPYAGTLFVDGVRDRRALGEAAAERIQQFGRRVARRAPISFPLLVELARRMRQSR